MGQFYWEPDWLAKLETQEAVLRWPRFDRTDALALGLEIERHIREDLHAAAAIRIVEDSCVIFACKMPGTGLENDWWMDRKLAVARAAGVGSLRAGAEAEAGLRTPFWDARPGNFAPCGGCMPVLPANGGAPWAWVLVSGLEHWQDHQVIADAMARRLGVEVPRIEKTN